MTYQEALDWIHGQLKFGIVGTNGKGSTVNALQTIFTQAGYEVGTFTSPYIIDFKERISLNGQMISEEDLLDLVNRVKPVVERLPKETEHSSILVRSILWISHSLKREWVVFMIRLISLSPWQSCVHRLV